MHTRNEMPDVVQAAPDNYLLRALRPPDFERLRPHLQPSEHASGEILYEPGDSVSHAYFPLGRALAAHRVMLPDGRGVETALIGSEGAIGGIVSHGRLPAYARAVVQYGGNFLKISSSQLEAQKRASNSLNHLFARYADCLLAQIFQSTACNATHSIEERAAKWILAAQERLGSQEVPLTQEQLGSLLGVGRSYVSRVIQKMRVAGLVETRRGRIVIRKRAELAARACGCAKLVRHHYEEVLGGVYSAAFD